MSLLILTSKASKTLTDTDELKDLFTESTNVLVTDWALHNLQDCPGFNHVKDFIDRGFMHVIDTVLIDKIVQYKESNLDIEECSIRKVVDIYAEKESAVIVLVNEDWVEMQSDNIEIISTATYLNRINSKIENRNDET